MKDYFRNRKTIRKYSDKAVDMELIYQLLEDAMRAPTTGNMQLYSVVVTEDKELRAKLAPTHFNQPCSVNAPVLITFCADFNRFNKWCELRGAEPGYDNFQSFVTALLDATILTQQFNTIAELNGLACCYLGTTTYNADKIGDVLELPQNVIPVTTLAVGYPIEDENSAPVERLDAKHLIHKDKYTDYTDQDINDIYTEKESLAVNQAYVKENNKESLAAVFTDIRYTRANNEHFSKVLYNYIEKQGFAFPQRYGIDSDLY
ncbi:MAG: nitroreductase family protein [Bacteroidales bacterium]